LGCPALLADGLRRFVTQCLGHLRSTVRAMRYKADSDGGAANVTLSDDDKAAAEALLSPFWTGERAVALLKLLVRPHGATARGPPGHQHPQRCTVWGVWVDVCGQVVRYLPLTGEDLAHMADTPEDFMVAEDATLFSQSLRVRTCLTLTSLHLDACHERG
jgi:hypothetical protein